jgi:hypothetical protein
VNPPLAGKLVRGIIGAGLLNGRIDLHVKRATGEVIYWDGVVLLDDKAQPIDFWLKATAFVQWRDLIAKRNREMTDREVLTLALSGEKPEDHAPPRIGVLEMWEARGSSRTVYVEPGDEIFLCRKHEP